MATLHREFRRIVVGAFVCGGLAVGCGGGSDSDDPAAVATITPTPTGTAPASPVPTRTASLVTEGARLFMQETFDGNGRTCGTCHAPEAGFTLTPEFVASRPPDDPLFVAERVPALAGLENSVLLRGPRALIQVNVRGFDQPPVLRGVPHIFDVAVTPPFGWSGSIFSLQDAVDVAIRQHFPRTLRRIPGVDFRVPTPEERAAMVAFMESTTLVPSGIDDFDFNPLVRTEAQARGAARFFGAARCSVCHNGPAFTSNAMFATGVTRRPANALPPPGCTPPCASVGEIEEQNGSIVFNAPTLLGLGNSAPYFHDNSAATLREAVAHYVSPAFTRSLEGVGLGIVMTESDIDDVTAFLEALTTCGDGVPTNGEPCDDGNRAIGDGCRPDCTVERCGDGILDPGERCDRGVGETPEDCRFACGS